MKSLKSHIKVIKKAIDKELCNDIVEAITPANMWQPSTVGAAESDYTHSPNIRSCDIMSLALFASLDQRFLEQLQVAASAYSDYFPYLEIQQDSGYDCLRYREGQFYTEHIDGRPDLGRVVSCSINLNSGYEGGEISFFGNTYIPKVGQGDALLFPSNFMYPHQVLPVTKGTRYSIVTWLT